MVNILDIGIPCFNEASYLNTCLNSIEQYCNGHYQDIQIWVVDDDSMYSSDYLNVIQSHSALTIKYIKNEKNSGPGFCRNIAINQGKAKWITFIDDDDVFCDNPFLAMDDQYDLIVSILEGDDITTHSRTAGTFFSSVAGILFSREYISNNNFHFFERLGICGSEDSIFLLLTTLSTYAIKYIKAFVIWYKRSDSSFYLKVPFSQYLNISYLPLQNLIALQPYVNKIQKKELLFRFLEAEFQLFIDTKKTLIDDVNECVLETETQIYYLLFFKIIHALFTKQEIMQYAQNSILLPLIYATFNFCTFKGDSIMYYYKDNPVVYDNVLPITLATPGVPIMLNYRDFYEHFSDIYVKPDIYRNRKLKGLPKKYWSE